MKVTDDSLDKLVNKILSARSKMGRGYVVWRYLPGDQVKVKHALEICNCHTGHVTTSRCGIYTWGSSVWMGTGSQDEYEHVETLRECKSCVRTLAN